MRGESSGQAKYKDQLKALVNSTVSDKEPYHWLGMVVLCYDWAFTVTNVTAAIATAKGPLEKILNQFYVRSAPSDNWPNNDDDERVNTCEYCASDMAEWRAAFAMGLQNMKALSTLLP
jgi:hypothetical protein